MRTITQIGSFWLAAFCSFLSDFFFPSTFCDVSRRFSYLVNTVEDWENCEKINVYTRIGYIGVLGGLGDSKYPCMLSLIIFKLLENCLVSWFTIVIICVYNYNFVAVIATFLFPIRGTFLVFENQSGLRYHQDFPNFSLYYNLTYQKIWSK